MADIHMTVRDVALNISRRLAVPVDDHLPIRYLVTSLVMKLQWPEQDIYGHPIPYVLSLERPQRKVRLRDEDIIGAMIPRTEDLPVVIIGPLLDGGFPGPPPTVSGAPPIAPRPSQPRTTRGSDQPRAVLNINVTVQDATAKIARDLTIIMDAHLLIRNLTGLLVQKLAWPEQDINERRIHYALRIVRAQQDVLLWGSEMLGGAGLQNGDVLLIGPVPGAGGLAAPAPVSSPAQEVEEPRYVMSPLGSRGQKDGAN